MLGFSNLKNKNRYNTEKFLFNRRNPLILVILDTLGILGICWKTQAANLVIPTCLVLRKRIQVRLNICQIIAKKRGDTN